VQRYAGFDIALVAARANEADDDDDDEYQPRDTPRILRVSGLLTLTGSLRPNRSGILIQHICSYPRAASFPLSSAAVATVVTEYDSCTVRRR